MSAWPNITPVIKEKISMFEGLEGDDFRWVISSFLGS